MKTNSYHIAKPSPPLTAHVNLAATMRTAGLLRRSCRLQRYSTNAPVTRVGFIGAGEISALHALALKKLPGVELHGLWSRPGCHIVPNPAAKAEEYDCMLYDSVEDLISDPMIDAVFVLTNYESHLKYALMALEAYMYSAEIPKTDRF
jgi:hypothetical protein